MAAARRRYSVLYVEDDPMSGRIMQRTLEEVADVTLAYDVQAALKILDGAVFDLVLVDLVLPGVRGFEGVKAIHEKTRAPVVIYTGMLKPEDEQYSEEAGAAGADAYLVKDGNHSEFRHNILLLIASYHRREADRLLAGGRS